MNIITKLRSPIATLIVLCAALLSQMPHAADVFRLLVAGEGFWAIAHGYAYAIALELAVLLFVVQRRDAESYAFAVVSIFVNLSYYALHGTQLFSIAALPAWLVSIALPAAIARYSHLLVEAPADVQQSAPEYKPAKATGGPQKGRKAPVMDASTNITASEAPAQAGGQGEADSAPAEPPKLAKAARQQRIKAERITDPAAIAAQFRVSLRTAQMDLADVREGVTQTNGKGAH